MKYDPSLMARTKPSLCPKHTYPAIHTHKGIREKTKTERKEQRLDKSSDSRNSYRILNAKEGHERERESYATDAAGAYGW